jgi:hypothetical protein
MKTIIVDESNSISTEEEQRIKDALDSHSPIDDIIELHIRKDRTFSFNRPVELVCARIVDNIIGKAIKDDADKPMWDLLPIDLIEEAVKVLTFGAKKYSAYNWKGLSHERQYAALMRHIVAYNKGEKIDPESGITHLAHAVCNLIFLYEGDKE